VAYADGEMGIDGSPRLDSMLALYLRPAPGGRVDLLTPSHLAIADALARAWRGAEMPRQFAGIACLAGGDTRGKLEIARAAAEESGRTLYVVGARQLPAHQSDIDVFAALWKRDSLLYPLALFIQNDQDELPTGENGAGQRAALERLLGLARESGPIVLASREMWQAGEAALEFDVEKPKRGEQQELWEKSLEPRVGKEQGAKIAGKLAWQFNLDAGTIVRLAGHVDELDGQALRVQRGLWQACRKESRPALEGLARRIDARAVMDDIVLPAAQKALLQKIAGQVAARSQVYHQWGFAERSNRGLGIAALFAGESGTGKTMAAEVLANELGLDLYRIDLSAVVSKYIGDTEKNLRRLFDGAEDGGAILLFDEADALFGKRSEVKDSHDRYSNIEINYLLQRMESYRGLAILATNMKSALDSAFLRRLRFTLDFPVPSAGDRQFIWERAFPAAMLEALGHPEIDYARLASLKLVGGNIHSIALNSAFMAAGQSLPLTTELILRVAREEFVKLGRHVVEEDFAAGRGIAEMGAA
jgi:hypothetical protein